MRRLCAFLFTLIVLPAVISAQDLRLPMKDGSVRFAVIGDSGTGDRNQLAVANQLAAWRTKFPFEFVIMLGDNLYGREGSADYDKKFGRPYKTLLDAGVKFYASLGNHDETEQSLYKPFNMNGEQYYSFKPERSSVRFFAINTNYMDQKQLTWLEKELAASGSDWKIPFAHHPVYSSSDKRRPNALLREQLEPLFVKYGVDVMFSGHEHFYERTKPQQGIVYFIEGNSAKVRRGDLLKTELTVKGWDQGYTFMLVEIAGDELHVQTISHEGQTIDAGVIRRVEKKIPAPARGSSSR